MIRRLLLFSGGIDSTLMLVWAIKQAKHGFADVPTLLMFLYGERRNKESEYAIKTADFLENKYEIKLSRIQIDLRLLFSLSRSNLLQAGAKTDYPNVHNMYVPGRNAIFLSIAMSIAEGERFDEIWFGPDFSDRINLFPDTSQEWVIKFNEIAEINGSCPLMIKAPLLGLTQEDVKNFLEIEGININAIHSERKK